MAKAYKRLIRIEKAVRLEACLYTDAEIAQHLNLTPAGLAQVKLDPDYDSVRRRIRDGIASETDNIISREGDYVRDRIREMVPAALDSLYKAAISNNEHIRLRAATQILNRDGRVAEVSRIGLPTEDQGGAGTKIDDDIAAALTGIMKLQKEREEKEQQIDAFGQKISSEGTIQ